MIITKEAMGWISLIIAVIGYVPYIISIIRRKTKPHAFSWIVWTIVLGITFVAQYSDEAGAGSWATGISAMICVPISIMAVLWGEKNITRGDWISFLGALAAIPVWVATRDALWAVILVTFIDASVYYPTLRKSWIKPYDELTFQYVIAAAKYVFALLAVDKVSVVTTLYPTVSILMEASVVLVLTFRRHVFVRYACREEE